MRAPGNKARGVEDARKSFCRIERLRGGCRAGELHERGKAPRAFGRHSPSERDGVSTAPLRQTVRALEPRLGVRLLNRTTRSVAPTDAGERLLSELRPLLDGF